MVTKNMAENKKENEREGKLKITACAILNEDKPKFFAELMSKGVDAVEPEMEKQLKETKKITGDKEMNSPESPRVEKLFERIAYEPTNGVSRITRISTTNPIRISSGRLLK